MMHPTKKCPSPPGVPPTSPKERFSMAEGYQTFSRGIAKNRAARRTVLAAAVLRFQRDSHKKKNEKLEYMHANPVVRGLVELPKDWPWSSFSILCKRGSRIGRDRFRQCVVMRSRINSKKRHPRKPKVGGEVESPALQNRGLIG